MTEPDVRLPLLVTGFEPFDGRRRNRSWDAVSGLAGRPGIQVQQLPVHFARLRQEVPRLVSGLGGLLLVGEAPVAHLCVEQVALNVVDSTRPDNAGATARMEPLVADGPLALRVAWDAGAVARRLGQERIPAAASFHAGTYACNAALYLALHAAASRVPVGFLHVPHRGWPFGLRTSVLRRAIEVCLDALAAEARVVGLAIAMEPFGLGRQDFLRGGHLQTTVVLPGWRGFQSRGGPYGSRDSRSSSDGTVTLVFAPEGRDNSVSLGEDELRLVRWTVEHAPAMQRSLLEGLLARYPAIRQKYAGWIHAGEMPEVRTADELRSMIGLHSLHVHPLEKDGVPYVGFELGCTWDGEHGLGVLMHGTRVVEIGGADTAFTLWIAEADAGVES